MALEQTDLEQIERLIYKSADDIAISIARSFERLEERVDAAESRLYTRLAEVEDRVSVCETNLTGEFESLRDVMNS